MDEKLTTREAADMLGLTTSRIRQMALDGSLAGSTRRKGRDWDIDPAEVQRLLQARQGDAGPKRGRPARGQGV